MSCKLFVANFPYSTTNEELNSLFSPHGSVLSVKVATDRETGRSRGFGFVEMGSEQEAETAIRELDGYQIGGRSLAVRVAGRARPGGGPGGGPRGPRAQGPGGGFGRGPRDDMGGGFGRGPRPPRSGPPLLVADRPGARTPPPWAATARAPAHVIAARLR